MICRTNNSARQAEVILRDLRRSVTIAIAILGGAGVAYAQPTEPSPAVALAAPVVAPKRIAGFRARGQTKVTDTTLGYLAHVRIGRYDSHRAG